MYSGADMSSRKHLANAIRALSMDGVQQANSGHPGAPMGMADIAEVLWRSHLNHNPSNPESGRPRSLCAVKRSWVNAYLLSTALKRLRAIY